MKTLVTVLVLMLLCVPARGAEPEFDVIHLKNGRTVEGVIIEETTDAVVIQSLVTGRKGQTVGAASVRVPRRDIERIVRISAEARRKLLARSKAFGDRHRRLADALEAIEVTPRKMGEIDGFHTVRAHFELISTCDEPFVREVTRYLDEVFAAYEQSFGIRRNADGKVKVLLLADEAEYRGFQKEFAGQAFANPAFYSKAANLIAAYNMVQRDEAEAIRKRILETEKKIREQRAEIGEYERKLRKDAADIRRRITDEAARARRQIKGDSRGDKAERLRRVDKWKREKLALLREREKAAREKLAGFRKRANEAIEHNRGIITQNRRLLIARNRAMYEMLFHEGFHAFARNFLWREDESGRVPRWLDEGLASYYEMSAVEIGELIHGAAHPRFLAILKDKMAEGALLPLSKVLIGDQKQFIAGHRNEQDRASLYYAQSWAMMHYLIGRVPRERMEAYVAEVLAGKDPIRAFERMTGKPVMETDVAIRKHIESLE